MNDSKVDKLVSSKLPGQQNNVILEKLSLFEQLKFKQFLHDAMNFTSKTCFRKVDLDDNIYVCCDESLYFDIMIMYAHEIFEMMVVLNGD